MGLSIGMISLIGNDASVLDIESKGSIITFMKNTVGRNLQSAICLQNINELPLWELIRKLNAPTTGSKSFRWDHRHQAGGKGGMYP